MIDGVFAPDGERLRFHPAGRLTRDDVADVVAVAACRIERLLQRRGVMATSEERGAADTWAEEAPVLAGLAAASVQGRLALGPRAGAESRRAASLIRAVEDREHGRTLSGSSVNSRSRHGLNAGYPHFASRDPAVSKMSPTLRVSRSRIALSNASGLRCSSSYREAIFWPAPR